MFRKALFNVRRPGGEAARHSTEAKRLTVCAGQALGWAFGRQSVAAEQATGTGFRLDIATKRADKYWFYEIKTASSARMCIRDALGQLLDYSCWPGSQEAERLIVVGEPILDAEAAAYLVKLRDHFGLPIYYQQFDLIGGRLVE
jgi:hypothetical protein